ncbi:MAG: hypothetical protein WCI30_07185 [Clostridia bacterium]
MAKKSIWSSLWIYLITVVLILSFLLWAGFTLFTHRLPTNKQLANDVLGVSVLIPSSQETYKIPNKLVNVEVLRHNGNRLQGTDSVTLQLIIIEQGMQLRGKLQATYLVEDNVWQLQKLTMIGDNFIRQVANSITADEIKASFLGITIPINEKNSWALAKIEEIKELEIITKKTNLSKGTERLQLIIVLENSTALANVKLNCNYTFKDGQWKLANVVLASDGSFIKK